MNLNYKKTTITIMAIILLACTFCFVHQSQETAYADTYINNNEIYYFDDLMYSSSLVPNQETETFEYSYKTVNEYLMNNYNSYPQYFNTNSGISNACANVAGANIVGYFNRYYDLIPNYASGILRNDIYTYYPMAYEVDKKQSVINTLYTMMNTNNPNPGTSQPQYKAGLNNYVNSKGKSIAFNSIMSNGNINLSIIDSNLRANKPISLFLSGYNITSISDNNTTVTLKKNIYNSNHIMIVFGYKQCNFYNNNALIRTETFLCIASGTDLLNHYYMLNYNGIINDVESAYIY